MKTLVNFGITKDNEISIYGKFKDRIKFENNRDSVKLPVK